MLSCRSLQILILPVEIDTHQTGRHFSIFFNMFGALLRTLVAVAFVLA